MTAALLLGTGFGLGVIALFRGVFPARTPLATSLAELNRTPTPPTVGASADDGWTARLGRPFAPILAGLGLPTQAVQRDLAVLGRPVERLLAEKATAALAGLLLPPTMAFLLTAGGLAIGWAIPAWASLVLTAVAFFVPDLIVRAEAANRRAEFRHALSSFLDLVAIALAGGAGVEAALTYGASIGSGWAFDQIRQILAAAQLSRRPPWENLAALGRQLGVTDLVELAGSVSLAGIEGAKVRDSLAVKAAALRAHQLTDAEAAAQAATERLSLPVVLLFAGFLTLIGFPAIANVLIGF